MHKTISNVFFLRNYSHFHSNICSWGCSWWFVKTGSGKRLCASLACKIMACCLTAWAISWTNFDWRLLTSFPGQFLRKHPKYVDKNVYSKIFMNIFASSRGVWGDKAFTHLSLVPHICIRPIKRIVLFPVHLKQFSWVGRKVFYFSFYIILPVKFMVFEEKIRI